MEPGTISAALFLAASLYGAGQTAAATQAIAAPQADQANTATTSPLTQTQQIEAYVRSQSVDEPILVDIAFCESTFRQYDATGNVLRGKVDPDDIGVMQINADYHGDEAKDLGYDIYTVEGNVAFAKYLYSKYGSDPWSSSKDCWSQGNLAFN